MRKSIESLGNLNLPFVCLSGPNLDSVSIRKASSFLMSYGCCMKLVRKRLVQLSIGLTRSLNQKAVLPHSVYIVRPRGGSYAGCGVDLVCVLNKLKKFNLNVSAVFIEDKLYYNLNNYNLFINADLKVDLVRVILLVHLFRLMILSVFFRLKLSK